MKNSPEIKKIASIGVIIILLFIGGFIAWATLSPLESAAIATGQVTVAGNRRVIQHLEGGIIEKIYVKDGSIVKKNELLIKLKDVQARANNLINLHELWELLGAEARVEAEINDQKEIEFPKILTKNKSDKSQEIIRLQKAIFNSNQKTFISTISIYNQRIDQLQEQINAQKAKLVAYSTQLDLINKELKDVKVLAAKKLITQARLLALEREAAEIEGKKGEEEAIIAQLLQKIGETKLEIISITDKRRKELLTELKDTQKLLSQSKERTLASSDTLARTEIRSPIAGTVVNLKVHTIGGVIRPGEEIMEIVPRDESLLITARISPLDIDVVHKGLKAKVSLSGLSKRNTPTLIGEVVNVSADALLNETDGRPYYQVKVKIESSELKKLKDTKLYPGMPAEVMIIVDESTPWEYFTTPIINSFDRAFREQ